MISFKDIFSGYRNLDKSCPNQSIHGSNWLQCMSTVTLHNLIAGFQIHIQQ